MESVIISSRQNALVKHARAVRDGREAGAKIFIEGLRLSEEAISSGIVIEDVLYTEKLLTDERGGRLLFKLKAAGARLSPVNEDVLAYASDTRTPQGIILLGLRPQTGSDSLPVVSKSVGEASDASHTSDKIDAPLIVLIHGINNPSNAGAMLRTAEAAGATGIICTRGTADLFSPRALRGAMGSSFRLPLWTGADFTEAIEWCRQQGIRTVGASLSAAKTHTEADWTQASALVLGSEATGLSEREASVLSETIRIPMRAPVESLNVAVACGIILYEAARVRSRGGAQTLL